MRRVFSGRKHLDLHEHVSLRGEAREGGSRLAQWERRESPALRQLRVDDQGVLEQLRRRGAFSHLVMRRSHARRGEALHSRPLGPCSPSSSFQPVIGATGGGVVPSPASDVTKSGDLRRSTCRRACSAGRRALMGFDMARCPLISREMSYRTPCSSKGVHGKRGQTRRAWGSKRVVRSRRARIGRSRGVLARCS
jgi:hypothetical protein